MGIRGGLGVFCHRDHARRLEDAFVEEREVEALRAFVQPSFELTKFQKHYDSVTQAAEAAYDIYHDISALCERGH